jgi:hypothetical protein
MMIERSVASEQHVCGPADIGIPQRVLKSTQNALAFVFREDDRPDTKTRKNWRAQQIAAGVACSVRDFVSAGQ